MRHATPNIIAAALSLAATLTANIATADHFHATTDSRVETPKPPCETLPNL